MNLQQSRNNGMGFPISAHTRGIARNPEYESVVPLFRSEESRYRQPGRCPECQFEAEHLYHPEQGYTSCISCRAVFIVDDSGVRVVLPSKPPAQASKPTARELRRDLAERFPTATKPQNVKGGKIG